MVDAQGNVAEIASVIDWPESIYRQAAADVMKHPAAGGVLILGGRRWQYLVSPAIVEFRSSDSMALRISGQFSSVRFLDITDSHQTLTTLAWTLCGIAAIIIVIFFFISRFFANRAIRPMEEAWNKQTRFIADASHELKTPLSIINANCGVLYANREEAIGTQLKWVDSILSNTDRMTGLIRGLLSLAQLEGARDKPRPCPFNLSETLESAAREMEPVAAEKELHIVKQLERDIEITSDQERIRQVLLILLDNAVKYTEPGGCISVSLEQGRRQLACVIRNTGEGITAENLPRVFDRFYRGDPSRSSGNRGYGLGLAIAKDITDQLGITLTADSKQGEYAEFAVLFDISASASRPRGR
jgi:signal transduction histidine kinase